MKTNLDMIWNKFLDIFPWTAGAGSGIPIYAKVSEITGSNPSFSQWCIDTGLTVATAIIVTGVSFFVTKLLRKLTNKKDRNGK